MKVIAASFGMGTPRRLTGHVVLATVVCVAAVATYFIAGRVAAEPRAHVMHSSLVGRPPRAALPAENVSPAKPPSAAEFTAEFIGVVNAYARAHGELLRITRAECVGGAGHYMCSYATTIPGTPVQCHVMQALWSPRKASTFTVTLAGRAKRCGSLREALRSLK